MIQMCHSCCVLSAQDIDENVAVSQRFIDLNSDESMVDLAYSDDKYKAVGAVYWVLKFPCLSPIRTKIGSVFYAGGHTCISAAHCLVFPWWNMDRYFITGYQVSFELSRGEHTFFDVQEYVVPSDYSKNRKADIALLRLNALISGLCGLELSYVFGKSVYFEEESFCPKRPLDYKLTYVGYGHGGNDGDYFVFKDDQRRACKSAICYVTSGSQDFLILSLPYKLNAFCTDGNLTFSHRSTFKDEFVVRPGMSGGPTFYDGKVVGVNSGVDFVGYSYADICFFYVNDCVRSVVNLFNFSSMSLRKAHPCTGMFTYSVALGGYEEWIGEHRARFDGMLPPQSRVIRADERMFGDIEQGDWLEAPGVGKDKTE